MNLLKSFPIRLLEECEGEGEAERWRLLKKLLIGSATSERIFFLGSLGFCGLSFFMLVVRDNESCAAVCGSIVQIQRFAGPHSRALSSLACISSLPTLFRTQASSPECKPTFFSIFVVHFCRGSIWLDLKLHQCSSSDIVQCQLRIQVSVLVLLPAGWAFKIYPSETVAWHGFNVRLSGHQEQWTSNIHVKPKFGTY